MSENGQIELAVVKGNTSGVFSLGDTGITIAEDTSFDQWVEGLKFLKWTSKKVSVGVASYIDFGNRHFGKEKVDGALEQLEFEATLVKTAIKINDLPTELRFANLTGDHYLQLARSELPQAKKVEWARIASDQHLTPTQLRFSMLENAVVEGPAARALKSGVITIHGIRQQFDVWLSRVGGLNGILKMDEDHREEIMGELEAIVQLGQNLMDSFAKRIEG